MGVWYRNSLMQLHHDLYTHFLHVGHSWSFSFVWAGSQEGRSDIRLSPSGDQGFELGVSVIKLTLSQGS